MDLDKPSDYLTVTFRKERRELFMSFLRLNSCLRLLGEPERLATVMIDPDMTESIMRVMLAEKAGPGEYLDFELGEMDVPPEDVDKILIWVRDHLSYFFMKRFQQLGDQALQLGPVAEALKSSLLGSESSTSSEAAAGPSA